MNIVNIEYLFTVNSFFTSSQWDHEEFVYSKHSFLKIHLGNYFLDFSFSNSSIEKCNIFLNGNFVFIARIHQKVKISLSIENNILYIKVYVDGNLIFSKEKLLKYFPFFIKEEFNSTSYKRQIPFNVSFKPERKFSTNNNFIKFMENLIFVISYLKRYWKTFLLLFSLFVILSSLFFLYRNKNNKIEILEKENLKLVKSYDSLSNLRLSERLAIELEIDNLTNQLSYLKQKTEISQNKLDSLKNEKSNFDNYVQKLKEVRRYINEKNKSNN